MVPRSGLSSLPSRRQFLLTAGIALTTVTAGCSSVLSSSAPEPTQTLKFQTKESVIYPSRLSVARGGEILTVTRVEDHGGTPRLREAYLAEHAEPFSEDLQFDPDKHTAVVIEVVHPEYQELANRQVSHEDETLTYSYRLQPSGTASNAVVVTHVLDVWDREFLAEIDAIEVNILYREE